MISNKPNAEFASNFTRNDGRSRLGSSEYSMQRQGRKAHAIHKQFSLLLGHEDVSRLTLLELLYIFGCKIDIFVARPTEREQISMSPEM
jgi:hypothetical protein